MAYAYWKAGSRGGGQSSTFFSPKSFHGEFAIIAGLEEKLVVRKFSF
jgi:hypothetical protein